MPAILALKRQENRHKLEVSLVYRPSSKPVKDTQSQDTKTKQKSPGVVCACHPKARQGREAGGLRGWPVLYK